jgi:hypothetical protein
MNEDDYGLLQVHLIGTAKGHFRISTAIADPQLVLNCNRKFTNGSQRGWKDVRTSLDEENKAHSPMQESTGATRWR